MRGYCRGGQEGIPIPLHLTWHPLSHCPLCSAPHEPLRCPHCRLQLRGAFPCIVCPLADLQKGLLEERVGPKEAREGGQGGEQCQGVAQKGPHHRANTGHDAARGEDLHCGAAQDRPHPIRVYSLKTGPTLLGSFSSRQAPPY